MDSSGSSISSLGTVEATQLLKELLHVGKARSAACTSSETSTASLASNVKEDMQNTSLSCNENGRAFVRGEGDHRLATSGGDMEQQTYSSEGDGDQPLRDSAEPEAAMPSNGEASLNELFKSIGHQVITKQQILLTGDDVHNSFSVYGREVSIMSSPASASTQATAGSNKVKINPVVNFDWEHKHYIGNLVAVHRNGIHVAYVLRGKGGGIVRVINRKTAERALLKGFTGRVIDIAFAHLTPVVLGAVDEIGNMFVYEVLESPEGKIDATMLLQVTRPADTPPSDNHRLIWCPYIPEEEESSGGNTTNTTTDSSVQEDVGKLLVLTHDHIAEMWNVDGVMREYGSGPLEAKEVEVGYLTISNHTMAVVDASFSPDGTALATASLDGEVKFFQVYLHDKSPPRCLHEWKPHGGKPVSSLFFLDDHKNPNPEVQFWKFAITGADNNQEIKVWSCESWTCLQTLHLGPSPELVACYRLEPCIKASMDLSANYLVLSDIRRKVLYVLHLHQDPGNGRAHVSSIAEFLLAQPCLSFSILEASRRRCKKSADNRDDESDLTTGEVHADDEEEAPKDAEGPDVGVLVKLYSVHTRALQELQIRYRPESSVPMAPPASSTMSHDESGFRDHLSDMSIDTFTSEMDGAAQPSDRSPNSDPTRAIDPTRASGGSHVSEASLASGMSHISEVPHVSETSHIGEASHGGGMPHVSEVSLHSHHSPHHDQKMESPNSRPLLMTPDAFTSPRGDIALPSDTPRSSGSSFTQVTAMDDDMRTPHGSVMGSVAQSQSQQSPSSSITLTPASSRDLSGGAASYHGTPTSVPLPPPTPGEDAALCMSGSMRSSHSLSGTPASTPPHHATPPHSASGLTPLGHTLTSTAASHEFLTSSPAQKNAQDFQPPVGRSDSDQASSEALDDIFHTRTSQRRSTLHSTGSSSSTSLEVSEILEGARKPGHNIPYEEPDDVPPPREPDIEGAERDQEGDGREDTADGERNRESRMADGIAEGEQEADVEVEEEEEEEEEEEDDEDGNVEMHTRYDARIWPRPPDVDGVDVNEEASRLAAEAIDRAASVPLQPRAGAEGEEEPRRPHVVDDDDDDDDDDEEEIPEELEQGEDDVRIEEEKEEIVEHEGAEVHRHRGQREPSAPRDSLGAQGREPTLPRAAEAAAVHKMQSSLGSMLRLLHQQQQEIQQLRSDIRDQRTGSDNVASLQTHIVNLETALASQVTGALNRHSQSETERLQQVLGERDTQEREKHNHLVTTLSQSVNATLSAKLDKAVKEEMKRTVLPNVTKLLEPIKEQLHTEMAQKLTATDTLMKESITKLVRSRQTLELIGQSVGNAVQGPVQAACRDTLIPAFDRSCQSVFHQLNQTFQRGTQDYTHQLEGHLEQVRRRHEESRDPIVQQLQSLVEGFQQRDEAHAPVYAQLQQLADSLQASVAQVAGSHAQLEASFQQTVTGLQDYVTSQIRQVVQEEVSSALREQQATLSDQLVNAMRSGAVTPVPVPPADPLQQKSQIMSLLRQGRLNTAFQQALSASDLSLVVFVCETVNPEQVFQQSPCPLQQPVLLSLIQQLSADFASHLELKHKYLEEAVMNLDMSNVITKEHAPAVLSQLCQKLSTFVSNNSHEPMARQLKMLLMITQGQLK